MGRLCEIYGSMHWRQTQNWAETPKRQALDVPEGIRSAWSGLGASGATRRILHTDARALRRAGYKASAVPQKA